jgi:hypothetical protein
MVIMVGARSLERENNDDEQLHESSIVRNIGMDGGMGRVCFPTFGVSVSPRFSGTLAEGPSAPRSHHGRAVIFLLLV